jgi:serine phosphatase RsbU (regulator of sigma subunit)
MSQPREDQPPSAGERASEPAASLPPVSALGGPRPPSRVASLALLAGLLVTAAFAITAHGIYDHNENRLLRLRAREVSSVLTASLPSLQTPLASAAEVADATAGNVQKLRAFLAPYVGPGRQFASVSLWRVGTRRPVPVTVLGTAPILPSLPRQARAFFAHVERSSRLSVTGILGASRPSLGFAFGTPGARHGFAVYAENPLPKNRRSKLAGNSAFSDLDYVLYLGHTRRRSALLVTSLHEFPIEGRQASQVVPFGDSAFTLVVTPRTPLGGSFFADLPWIVLLVGGLLSLAAALIAGRLARRREYAEELSGVLDRVAAENHRLYTEQRSIAQTLQHALLPDTLPALPGVGVSARYVPAASGIDVGGDWYDVVLEGERRLLLVVGDVSGHGLRAATTMAALRHATLAYAAEEASPARILTRLSAFVNSERHDYFATVLCVLIDLDEHRLTLASAGHMAPLLIHDGKADYAELAGGSPIGIAGQGPYDERSIPVAAGTTLIAFTDGLVERRGEVLDVGLGRLRSAASRHQRPLDDLLATLITDLAPEGHHDDTAIVGIRWER